MLLYIFCADSPANPWRPFRASLPAQPWLLRTFPELVSPCVLLSRHPHFFLDVADLADQVCELEVPLFGAELGTESLMAHNGLLF